MKKTTEQNNIVKKNTAEDNSYGYYSKVLKKPFDTVAELIEAEDVYYSELKAKEDKAAQKKADALKVEDAFKALNTARKNYKEDLLTLAKEYANALERLKSAFELSQKEIKNTLATAEDNYSKALKEFTDKYDTYHLSLKDGDFETTISSQTTSTSKTSTQADPVKLSELFDWFFGF